MIDSKPPPLFPASERFGSSQPGQSGFALVSTILIIAVLTIMVVAFLQSMRIDQLTARSYLNKTKADLMAEAGAARAIDMLHSLIETNPFHAIGSEIINGQTIPLLIGATDPNTTPSKYYLVSVPDSAVAPGSLTPQNSIDLNRQSREPGGWIGSPVLAGSLVSSTNRVPWIQVLQDPSLPNQPNVALPKYNPVVGRFAFWIEDETAKLDISIAGNNKGASGAFERELESKEPSQLDLGAIPLLDYTPLRFDPPEGVFNNQIIAGREALNVELPDIGLIATWLGTATTPPSSASLATVVPGIKFHSTRNSLSNELTSSGRRRVNLNHLVTNVNPTDGAAADKIRADLDDIIYAITGRHVFTGLSNSSHDAVFQGLPDNNEGPLPDFGKRFYTTPGMPIPTAGNLKSDHEKVYLLKLAANIRDYIDSDSLPTVIAHNGNVVYGTRPDFSWSGSQTPIAIGKEAIPFLQEHAFRFNFRQCDILAGSPANRRQISFDFDVYLEFFNPSTKNFTAPDNTILKIYNLPSFRAGAFPAVELEDLKLDLSGAEFPAGAATVVTTAPTPADDPAGLILNASRVIRVSPTAPANRAYNNYIGNVQVGSGTGDDRKFGIRLEGRAGSLDTDYSTEMVMSVPAGYLDAFPFLGIPGNTTFPVEMTRSANSTQGTWTLPAEQRALRLIWSASLRGNDRPSRSGDPRSLNEPLILVAGSNAAFGNDQGRFFANISGSGIVPGNATFGNAAMTFVNPTNWPDYSISFNDTSDRAYSVVRDGWMQSIGELGNIFDPHRKISGGGDGASSDPSEAVQILRARGGGRTLKIGQPDDLVSGPRFGARSETSVGWFNAAWRLADIFSVDEPSIPFSEETARGKLNVNGILRDNGVAFRSLLRSFRFLNTPDGDPGRANNLFGDAEIDELIAQIQSYLTTNGPFMERGELSQVPFFSGAGNTNRAGGQSGSVSMDRSREEIFRRVVEHITTRSASFSVYVVGESVQQRPNGTVKSLASSKQKVSFRVVPVIEDTADAVVTGYTIEIYEQTY